MPRAREIETLLLTMFAAVPLYLTNAIGIVPLVLFHAVMAGIAIRVALGRSPELIPAPLMRGLGIAYVAFYVIDAIWLSRSAIAASTHLVLFIAAYQPIESVRTNNYAQRLLTTALIFIASLATSTHMSIVLFVLVFAFLMFRQMMYVSHIETVGAIGRDFEVAPAARSAVFYLAGTALIGVLLFPLLPRLRNPLVKGFVGSLTNASTGLSDSIDFNQQRTSTPDLAVVARVWMGQETIPFFTPLRLRGAVYDAYDGRRWLQTRGESRQLQLRNGSFAVARPVGYARTAAIQQRLIKSSRLFLPVGTYAVSGLSQLYPGPTRDSFVTFMGRDQVVSYSVSMARGVEPLSVRRVSVVPYPVTPEIAAMARMIVGNETGPERQAAAIERYLLRNFTYVQRPEAIGAPMSVDQFLLHGRKGHCEYFAAGMVVLMTAVGVPARIVGGFYGGSLNPLTGYFLIRREDAHAWVEVWDGSRWQTFDPTPPSLRPGNAQEGLLRMYATAVGDSVNYFWDRYILTFGLGDQIALAMDAIARVQDVLSNTRRTLTSIRHAVFSRTAALILGMLAALAAAGVLLARSRQPLFGIIAAELRRRGIDVAPAMTVEEAIARLRELDPESARNLEPVIALYEQEQFSGRSDRERVRAIRRRLSELRA